MTEGYIMFMSRWKLERERRRKNQGLQLLVMSGAMRPADGYVRYRVPDILLGTGSSKNDLHRSEDFLAFAQTSEQL